MRRRFLVAFGHTIHSFGWQPFHERELSEDFVVFFGWDRP